MTAAQASALESRAPGPGTPPGGWLSATDGTIDDHSTRARAPRSAAAMRIAVGSDHAGFHLKEHVKAALAALGHEVVDVGTLSSGSVDYPQYAAEAARLVAAGDVQRGVLACGSGVGVAIVANKVYGVRAVNAHDALEAEMARR